MLYALLRGVVGAILFLVPAQSVSTTLWELLAVFAVTVKSFSVFLFALLVKNAFSFLWRGFVKFVIRVTVVHLLRLYVMAHPDITNAQVEAYGRRMVARLKSRIARVHGVRRIVVITTILSAALGVGAIFLLVGVVRVLYLLAKIVAPTLVGVTVTRWWRAVTGVLHSRWTTPYRRAVSNYRRCNMRYLRAFARWYRRVHPDIRLSRRKKE